MPMHASLPVAVASIVRNENKILLLKRKNTPWMNWFWGVPGGRLDAWETMSSGAVRELAEEVGIQVAAEDVLFKSIVQHKDDRGERIYFVILIEKFTWVPENIEKDKCSEIAWFEISNLPENITPQVAICLDAVTMKVPFQEYGY